MCCGSWSRKELETTERLNWTELNCRMEDTSGEGHRRSEKKNAGAMSLNNNKHTLSIIFPVYGRYLEEFPDIYGQIQWEPASSGFQNRACEEALLIRLTQVRHILWGTKSIDESGTGVVWLPQVPQVYGVKFLVGQWLQSFFKCLGQGVTISVSSSGHTELDFVHDFQKFSLKPFSIFLQTLLT